MKCNYYHNFSIIKQKKYHILIAIILKWIQSYIILYIPSNNLKLNKYNK